MPPAQIELAPGLAVRVAAVIIDPSCPITDDPARAQGAIVVVERADRRVVSRLLEAGAVGVVLAADIERSLPAAIAAVATGLTVVPHAGRQALQRPVLTARQQEILSLLVLGLPNAAIARRLFLAESTVKTHLSTIFDKLDVRSRKEAIDLILDPSTDLGAGIVGVSAGGGRGRDGYASPVIRS